MDRKKDITEKAITEKDKMEEAIAEKGKMEEAIAEKGKMEEAIAEKDKMEEVTAEKDKMEEVTAEKGIREKDKREKDKTEKSIREKDIMANTIKNIDIRKNDIDDTKLLEMMHAYVKEPGKETLLRLAMALKDTDVFVPVMINPQRHALQPYVIRNKEGELYVPAFTSVGKFPTDQQYQGMQKLPYKQCVSMLLKNDGPVEGIVLNPFVDNLMLKKQMLELSHKVETEMPIRHTATMKTEDFRMIIRHNVEFRQIPGKLYSGKLEFIRELSGELLCKMYNGPYVEMKQERICEYTADDFEIMELDVREDLNIVQIMLPTRYLYKTNCREMYIVWNPQTERVSCYVVEKGSGPDEKQFLLKEIKQDGSFENIEDAPAEGTIMNRVMELFEEC